jgi:hypothetical protein
VPGRFFHTLLIVESTQDLKMKTYLLIICAAAALAGCVTHQGRPGEDYDTERGTAREMRSPSGMDRTRGTNFENTAPQP